MKKLGILTVLLIIAFTGGAQTQKNETEGFSFGAKLGFSSTLPIINSLTIEGVEAQNVNLQYKVGYLAALFCRINIDRFFIMPGVEWNHADGSILKVHQQSLQKDSMWRLIRLKCRCF
mgnify:CR=1 FL=1